MSADIEMAEWRRKALNGEPTYASIMAIEIRPDGSVWLSDEDAITERRLVWESYEEAVGRAARDGKPLPDPPRDEHGRLLDPCPVNDKVLAIRRREYRLADLPTARSPDSEE